MYPIQCFAGFSVPAKAGKFEIVGFSVAAEDTALAIELGIIDDPDIKKNNAKQGYVLDTLDNKKNLLFQRKGIATYGVQVDSFIFHDPIKTRYGTSVYTSNVKTGTFCLYIR